jgi:SAM-dependent methyltransferase
MREIKYENEFDSAYNYFTAWGYFSDEENLDVLARVHRALKSGGNFLLEMINRDALMRRFQPQNWKLCTDNTIVLAEHSFDSETGRMTSTRTYVNEDEKTTIEIVHHLPSSDELVRMFRRAGFTEYRLVSAPDGGKAGIDSIRIAVIGTK